MFALCRMLYFLFRSSSRSISVTLSNETSSWSTWSRGKFWREGPSLPLAQSGQQIQPHSSGGENRDGILPENLLTSTLTFPQSIFDFVSKTSRLLKSSTFCLCLLIIISIKLGYNSRSCCQWLEYLSKIAWSPNVFRERFSIFEHRNLIMLATVCCPTISRPRLMPQWILDWKYPNQFKLRHGLQVEYCCLRQWLGWPHTPLLQYKYHVPTETTPTKINSQLPNMEVSRTWRLLVVNSCSEHSSY